MRARPKFPLFWLTLIAILAGTPARQVEAASDLARSLVDSDKTADDLTELDGGVGDDTLEAVTVGVENGSAGSDLTTDPSSLTELAVGWPPATWSPAFPDSGFGTHALGRPPDLSSLRHALLQRWLI